MKNMLFLRKTDETIWKTSLAKGIPPFNQPPISEHFFLTPFFVQFSKTRYPLSPNILGKEIYVYLYNDKVITQFLSTHSR